MSNQGSNPVQGGGGLGFVGALTLLFVGLKLTNVIDWSWWWVLSPVWITASLVIAALVFFVGVLVARWKDN